MANPLHSFESDNADVNLATGATIFSASNAGSVPRWVTLDVEVGDGTKDLDASSETTLTFQVTNGGVAGPEITVTVPSGQDRYRQNTDAIVWINSETLALSCTSDNASDTDVDVTVTARDVAPLQPSTSGNALDTSDITAILADANEVKSDLADGGRIDMLIDAILLGTAVSLPAEIAGVITVIDGLNDPSAEDIRAEIDSNSTQLAAIISAANDIETGTQDLQTQIGTAGAGLTDLGGMSTAMKAEIKTAVEVDGGKIDHLWETTEDDGGTRRFTTNALEQAPTGGGGGVFGPGATSYTVLIDDGTNPIDGAEVWVTTDSAGSNTIAGTLSTNASGEATFMLDAGDYYLWVQASEFNGTNPTAFTVS